MFVDLDGFKDVNDRRGHSAGDRLLAHAAARLVAASRDGDVVGRLGGDEFLVICRNVPRAGLRAGGRRPAGGRPAGADRPGRCAARARASLGVSWSAAEGATTADALIARADMAMYESKGSSSGTTVLR